MTEGSIKNLMLCILEGIPKMHPQAYMKQLGIEYVLSIPQSAFDAWWFLGCSNIPSPLPTGLRYIQSGHEEYLHLIDDAKKTLFIKKMNESAIKNIK